MYLFPPENISRNENVAPKNKIQFLAGDFDKLKKKIIEIILSHFFNQKLSFIVPSSVKDENKINKNDLIFQEGSLYITNAYLSSLCCEEMLSKIFKKSNIAFLSKGRHLDENNAFAILPNGSLILKVNLLSYQVLGIETKAFIPKNIRKGFGNESVYLTVDLLKEDYLKKKKKKNNHEVCTKFYRKIQRRFGPFKSTSTDLLAVLHSETNLSFEKLQEKAEEILRILKANLSVEADVHFVPTNYNFFTYEDIELQIPNFDILYRLLTRKEEKKKSIQSIYNKRNKKNNIKKLSSAINPYLEACVKKSLFKKSDTKVKSHEITEQTKCNFVEEFMQYIGNIFFNIPINKKEYIWLEENVEKKKNIDSIKVLTIDNGLISNSQVLHCFDYFLNLLIAKKIDWFILSVFGADDSPVSFSNFPHGYDLCGDNNYYICCFLNELETIKCLFFCDLNLTDCCNLL